MTRSKPGSGVLRGRAFAGGRAFLIGLVAAMMVLGVSDLSAQEPVTTPQEQFGFPMGADYHLANYQQLQAYWQKLAGESDRMVLDTIGFTEEGRPQLMAIITSPENHGRLDHYREISESLARARDLDESEARSLAREGKAVVWIDGGLHATEVLGAQQLIELVYQMVSRDDAETLRFLDDVILLAAHANPDGHDLVADWYMRIDEPTERTDVGVPVLYQKYAGHDNNRDFYMANLAETENMNRVLYREWYPQIVYNHHQTGPAGTVMFAPPFRDPPNHYLDGLILTSLLQVGGAMHGRFVQEGKGGTTMRSGASYSTWWNGGLRTTPYFHNMIGLLTETRGHPTPQPIDFVPDRQLPHSDLPLPVEPEDEWHFRWSVDYSQTANRAVLDYASRNKEHLLFNIWRMGKNSILRGSTDHWTMLPFEVDTAQAALSEMEDTRRVRGRLAGSERHMDQLLRKPEDRDPRGFILPSDQEDFPTAVKFVNALLKNGVEVHRAVEAFHVAGIEYPGGSLVVRADQAFRPHVLDMFEPQNHPNDFQYPGGPPNAPYDNAGWTLAYQMGVDFDRILDDFEGPFERVEEQLLAPPPARIAGKGSAGFLLSHAVNDAFTVVNRLLAHGARVYWMAEDFTLSGVRRPEGTFFVPAGPGVRDLIEASARELGVEAEAVEARPSGRAFLLDAPRIGLWDRYGGSMESGWIRFVLEQFEFDFELVFPPDLDAGVDPEEFDALVFPNGAVPSSGTAGARYPRGSSEWRETVPEPYRSRLGVMSVDTTVPRILDFVRNGGSALAIGSSTSLAYHAGLPVENHLVSESGESLSSDDFYLPGSVLDLRLDEGAPLAHGLDDRVNVLASRPAVFRVSSTDDGDEVRRVGWFDRPDPLRSGWAWGQEYLEGGATILSADVGEGLLHLYGPEITFRGQAHGTFPLLFNGIFLSRAEDVTLP